jgi:hypothetical protein
MFYVQCLSCSDGMMYELPVLICSGAYWATCTVSRVCDGELRHTPVCSNFVHLFVTGTVKHCSCCNCISYLLYAHQLQIWLACEDKCRQHIIRLCVTVCLVSTCVQHFRCLCSKSHHLPPDNPESLVIKQSANNPPCFLPEKALRRNSQVRNKFKSSPSVCASTVVVFLLTTITPENTEEDLPDPEPARLISCAARM